MSHSTITGNIAGVDGGGIKNFGKLKQTVVTPSAATAPNDVS